MFNQTRRFRRAVVVTHSPSALRRRWCTRQADLTLVTSQAMHQELSRHKCRQRSIDVWQRGIDTELFHPRFRCQKMRRRMTDGNPLDPLLVYVGRWVALLGVQRLLCSAKHSDGECR